MLNLPVTEKSSHTTQILGFGLLKMELETIRVNAHQIKCRFSEKLCFSGKYN